MSCEGFRVRLDIFLEGDAPAGCISGDMGSVAPSSDSPTSWGQQKSGCCFLLGVQGPCGLCCTGSQERGTTAAPSRGEHPPQIHFG